MTPSIEPEMFGAGGSASSRIAVFASFSANSSGFGGWFINVTRASRLYDSRPDGHKRTLGQPGRVTFAAPRASRAHLRWLTFAGAAPRVTRAVLYTRVTFAAPRASRGATFGGLR